MTALERWDPPVPLLTAHHASHRSLLSRIPAHLTASDRRPDAIFVLAYRRDGCYGQILEVAAQVGCPVILLCSGGVSADSLVDALGPLARVALIAVDFPAGYQYPDIRLGTSLSIGSRYRSVDVSEKRNVALLIARLLRWKLVMFLEDDVYGVDVEEIQRACRALDTSSDGLTAVGWALTDFDDNSVVCHARRLSGQPQDTFIGSGALLISCTERMPFFPRVYNEDWLFFFPLILAGGLAMGGEVRQLAYEPFRPRRARFEEFGDVLAEGLYALLHMPATARAEMIEDRNYWAGVLRSRIEMIRHTEALLKLRMQAPVPDSEGRRRLQDACESLRIARGMHRESWAGQLTDFVGRWLQDVEVWFGLLGGLDAVTDVGSAFEWLKLPAPIIREPG